MCVQSFENTCFLTGMLQAVWNLIVLESLKKLFSSVGVFGSGENEWLIENLAVVVMRSHWERGGSRFPPGRGRIWSRRGNLALSTSLPGPHPQCLVISEQLQEAQLEFTKSWRQVGSLAGEVGGSCQVFMPSSQWLAVCIALPFPVIFSCVLCSSCGFH